MTPLDPVFLRPIAHRGLHAAGKGFIENTEPAFRAAITKGYGIECDVRPARDGQPIVFHDAGLGRLVDAEGHLDQLTAAAIAQLRYRGQDTGIMALGELLDLVAGRVPLLVEVKSDWTPPNPGFIEAVAGAAEHYRGPVALMSFDPAMMAAFAGRCPHVPRGIVAGSYTAAQWASFLIDEDRAFRLSHLLESARAAPSFFAYDVTALPTPVTRFAREVLKLPLFTWAVRTDRDRHVAARWADAPIFEGWEP